jgi:hypothetical protein
LLNSILNQADVLIEQARFARVATLLFSREHARKFGFRFSLLAALFSQAPLTLLFRDALPFGFFALPLRFGFSLPSLACLFLAPQLRQPRFLFLLQPFGFALSSRLGFGYLRLFGFALALQLRLPCTLLLRGHFALALFLGFALLLLLLLLDTLARQARIFEALLLLLALKARRIERGLFLALPTLCLLAIQFVNTIHLAPYQRFVHDRRLNCHLTGSRRATRRKVEPEEEHRRESGVQDNRPRDCTCVLAN